MLRITKILRLNGTYYRGVVVAHDGRRHAIRDKRTSQEVIEAAEEISPGTRAEWEAARCLV